jgi:hypothetical protein
MVEKLSLQNGQKWQKNFGDKKFIEKKSKSAKMRSDDVV